MPAPGDRCPMIRMAMMPRDTNVHGTIFGGVILSQIDQAGAIACRACGVDRVVTVSMKEVVFREPVYVGDVVSFYAEVVRIGTTSMTVDVRVEAERIRGSGPPIVVTDAEVVYVSVDAQGKKMPVPRRAAKDG
jgi:acyl-CoA thioesterase YciA